MAISDPLWGLTVPPNHLGDGKVYVYRWNSVAWELQKILTSTESDRGFGYSVAISGDFVAVGHRRAAVEAPLVTGPVLLFGRNVGGANNWGLLRRFDPVDGELGFGTHIALEGNTLVVASMGVPGGKCEATIYERDQGGKDLWGVVARLLPFAVCTPGGSNYLSLSLSGDTLAASTIVGGGAVAIYDRDLGGPEHWGQAATIDRPTGVNFFGYEISLESDTVTILGNVLGPDGATLFIHERDEGGANAWGESHRIPLAYSFSSDAPVAMARDSISLGDEDGPDHNLGFGDEGQIHRYSRDLGGEGQWGELPILQNPSPASCTPLGIPSVHGNFGADIAVDGEAMLVGDPTHCQEVSGTPAVVGVAWVEGQPGSLQVVDVLPDLVRGGSVVTDPDLLARKGAARRTIAADGASRLLVRYVAPSAGSVVFSIDGIVSEDGGLDLPGGSQRLQSVSTPTVNTDRGFRAFAQYRAPDEFNRGNDESAEFRTVRIQGTFSPAGRSGAAAATFKLRLARPPLVLVHGLWSDSGTWTFPLATDSSLPVVERADYRATNAAHFAENSSEVRRAVERALATSRLEGIAATRVDLAAHSMGGILARIWSTDSEFAASQNYYLGNVRKLITLDTPHRGSPLADLLLSLRSDPVKGLALSIVLQELGFPIVGGAIDDLAVDSPAITAMAASPVPAHAIVGVGGSDALVDAPGPLGAFYTAVSFFSSITGSELFSALQHDMVVGRTSQEGGISGSAITVVGGNGGIHTQNTSDTSYSARTRELLDTAVTASSFSTLPQPSGAPTPMPRSNQTSDSPSQGAGLHFTSPVPGSIVAPGEVVTVVVEADEGAIVERVLLVAPKIAIVDDVAPFIFSVTIPPTSWGSVILTASGSNSEGSYSVSPSLVLAIGSTASLLSLSVTPAFPVLLGIEDSVQLVTMGTFSDGVTRDISDQSLGTSYTSSDSLIAEVGPSGLIVGRGLGAATIAVQNGAVSGGARLFVASSPTLIFEDGLESGTADSWTRTGD